MEPEKVFKVRVFSKKGYYSVFVKAKSAAEAVSKAGKKAGEYVDSVSEQK